MRGQTQDCGKAQVVEDNQRVFVERDRKNRTKVCFLGADVGDIGDRLGRMLSGAEITPTSSVRVGTA